MGLRHESGSVVRWRHIGFHITEWADEIGAHFDIGGGIVDVKQVMVGQHILRENADKIKLLSRYVVFQK